MKIFRAWADSPHVRTAGMILGAIALLFAVHVWRSGDERAIHRRLSRMRRLIEKKEDEKPLAGLARVREFAEYLSPKVDMHAGAPLPSLSGRQELIGVIHQYRAMTRTLSLSIRDRSLSISPDRQSAVMRMTVEAAAESQGSSGRDIRELEVEWSRESGAWVVRRIALIENIRRPAPAGSGNL